jgi:hypothetical protein
MKDSNSIFREFLDHQQKKISSELRLQYDDLKRITKYIDTSIFDSTECCIWNGYITNDKSANKGTYINFYFRGKKVALHRLLYVNYIGELEKDEYLKFTCDNKGKCCNIHHMKKFKYRKKTTDEDDIKKVTVTQIKEKEIEEKKNDKTKLILSFD